MVQTKPATNTSEALFGTAKNNPDVFHRVNCGDLRYEIQLHHKRNKLVTHQLPDEISKVLQMRETSPSCLLPESSMENIIPSWRISVVARGYGWGEVCPKSYGKATGVM